MTITQHHTLSATQKDVLLRLWNNEYPVELLHENVDALDTYLRGLANTVHHLLIYKDVIAGWAWAFDRNGERWFAIILDSSIQHMGYGSMLLSRLKENETVLCGWVEDNIDKVKGNGDPYLSPIAFYQKNGFIVYPEERLETDKASAVKIKWLKGD